MNATTSSDQLILSAARWFWWIAAFSLVNAMLFFLGSKTGFAVGLGMTTIVSVMLSDHKLVAFGLIALLIGFYYLMGEYAQREKAWAFYVGLTLYALDALIYVRLEAWMSVAFHAYAMYCIVQGVLRLREQNSLAAAMAARSRANC